MVSIKRRMHIDPKRSVIFKGESKKVTLNGKMKIYWYLKRNQMICGKLIFILTEIPQL